jgi:hypothetical protein
LCDSVRYSELQVVQTLDNFLLSRWYCWYEWTHNFEAEVRLSWRQYYRKQLILL